jgi:hypothetical protein
LRKKTTKSRFDLRSKVSNGSNSRSKVGRIKQKVSSGVPTCLNRKKRSWAKLEAKSEVALGKVLLDLPIRTKSEANCFEPWRLKHARHKEQQRIVTLSLKPLRGLITLPCKIMLTRFAPDSLDNFDNLPMSFKYIVDAVCAIITGEYRAGKADSDKRITIACGQVKSKEYGIRIEITY